MGKASQNIPVFRLIVSFLILTWGISFLWGGTTGKITGQVIDKSTNEPLPGANVIFQDMALGGVTDNKGYFTVLQVPPGVYTVQVSFIGYTKVIVADVRVQIDQTTKLNIALEPETLQGKTVTVVAEKRMVKEDVATSVTAVSNREIEELPVSNIQSVVGLQAGVQGLQIRGGGADEALIQMNGATLRDPRNNQPIASIPLSAIKEVSVERGGFNAEYGQVRSGVVNVVMKEGNPSEYHGTVTLKYSPPANKFFGISPYDRNSMWLRPYLDDAICWTGTDNGVWDEYTQRQYPDFKGGWNAISQRLMQDNDPTNDLTPMAAQRLFLWQTRKRPKIDQPDYNIDAGVGGPVPIIGKALGNLRFFSSYRRDREMLLIPMTRDDNLNWDWTLQFDADISSNIKLKISGLTGKEYTMAHNWVQGLYIRSPEDVVGVTCGSDFRPGGFWGTGFFSPGEIGHKAFSAKATHILNSKTYFEVLLEHIQRNYHVVAARERDPEKKYEIVPGYFVDEAPFGYSPEQETDLTGTIEFGGHTCKQRDFSKVGATSFRADLSSQVNYTNLVKTGFELVYNTLDLDFGQIQSLSGGKLYEDHVQMEARPIQAAMYIQDKLETQGFIANFGLRLDYSNSNVDWWDVDPYDRNFFSIKYKPSLEFRMRKSKSQFQLSPRLGISHPITENSKLFFNYGHFKQVPSYQELFRISRAADGHVVRFGDPDLILAKTISYELGYDHALFNDYLIQLAAFYHDIANEQSTTQYYGLTGITYQKTTSNNYRDIRGLEITLRKSRGRFWTAFANYTYQAVTRGFFGKQQIYQDPSRQKQYDELTTNLYQQRPIPRPYVRVNLTLYTPPEFGPKLLGGHPLANWMVNGLLDWQAGDWVTFNPNNIEGIQYNVQQKDYFNTIARVSKTFKFHRWNVMAFVDVDNVLNTRRMNLMNWGKGSDRDLYFQSLHLPKSRAYNNIPGHDRIGEYRKPGVKFQPIELRGAIDREKDTGKPGVIYYEGTSQKYYEYVNETWTEVEKKRMQKILDDKAYIDMPNATSFTFLNPRQFYFGIRISVDM